MRPAESPETGIPDQPGAEEEEAGEIGVGEEGAEAASDSGPVTIMLSPWLKCNSTNWAKGSSSDFKIKTDVEVVRVQEDENIKIELAGPPTLLMIRSECEVDPRAPTLVGASGEAGTLTLVDNQWTLTEEVADPDAAKDDDGASDGGDGGEMSEAAAAAAASEGDEAAVEAVPTWTLVNGTQWQMALNGGTASGRVVFSPWVKCQDLWKKGEAAAFEVQTDGSNLNVAEEADGINLFVNNFGNINFRHVDECELDPRQPVSELNF